MAGRRQSTEALRGSDARLDQIYQSIGESIVTIDDQQRIVLFNAAAERMFGHQAAAMIGQPLSVLLPERFRKSHEQIVRKFGATEKNSRTMETTRPVYGLRANGEEFPVECSISQAGTSARKLYTAVLRDITGRKQAEQAREQLIGQLEVLSDRLTLAQEEDQRKIARALHEELGQELSALKLFVQLMELGSANAATKSHRDEALAAAGQTLERLRNLVMDLAPPELDDFGLHSALRAFCERQALTGGWKLHIDAPAPGVRGPRPVERACFRVLQEGLRNVLDHARATEVWVRLHQSTNELELRVRDDGIGFDCNVAYADDTREHTSLGLFGMRNRAKQVGGSVEIKSATGAGTEIRAVFPLPAKCAARG